MSMRNVLALQGLRIQSDGLLGAALKTSTISNHCQTGTHLALAG